MSDIEMNFNSFDNSTQTIELKHAPRKCKHFCCGDCTITMKSCSKDSKEECKYFEVKALFGGEE